MYLRWRLTLWYVFIMGLVLMAFSIFLYSMLARSWERERESLLMAQAQEIAAHLEKEDGRWVLEGASLEPGIYYALWGSSGPVLGNLPPQLVQELAARGIPDRVEVKAAGRDWRVSQTYTEEQGQRLAVLVACPQGEIKARLRGFLFLLGLAVPGTLFVAAGGGLFLARRALEPIERISARARFLSATDLSQRLGLPHGKDEVGRLVATLDGMLERLEEAFERQRQFTADASHELRTPLALIRSRAEEALARNPSPEEYREVLQSIVLYSERMGEILAKLLFLARLDSRGKVEGEVLSLRELLEGVAEEYQEKAQARGLVLLTDFRDEALVWGDQTCLVQLFVNLLDNAVKYTEQGHIKVGLEREGNWAVVRVEDTGPDIPPQHLPRIFERFYRVDKARDRERGGAGLGLAIAATIARAHGGTIQALSSLGQGSTFIVKLPLFQFPLKKSNRPLMDF